MAGCDDVIARYGLPAHTVGMGSKGCVVMSTEPIREYRDYLTKIHHALTELAWLYHMNNGVFMTPGRRRGVDAVRPPHGRGPAALRRGVRALRLATSPARA